MSKSLRKWKENAFFFIANYIITIIIWVKSIWYVPLTALHDQNLFIQRENNEARKIASVLLIYLFNSVT